MEGDILIIRNIIRNIRVVEIVSGRLYINHKINLSGENSVWEVSNAATARNRRQDKNVASTIRTLRDSSSLFQRAMPLECGAAGLLKD